MKQLIDKSDLIAEIERRIKYDEMVMDHDAQITELLSRELNTLYELSSFINTIEVKHELTWQDIELIATIGMDFMNSEDSDDLDDEAYYTEILNRFNKQRENGQ